MASTCSSCHAPVIWAITEKGKRIPLDPGPVDGGNLVITSTDLDGTPHVRYLAKTETLLDALNTIDPADRRVTHFVTCPQARSHRR